MMKHEINKELTKHNIKCRNLNRFLKIVDNYNSNEWYWYDFKLLFKKSKDFIDLKRKIKIEKDHEQFSGLHVNFYFKINENYILKIKTSCCY